MANIKCFKMISGEDVIGNIKKEDDATYTLDAPATLLMQPSQEGRVNMGIMPYMPYVGDNMVVLFKSAVASMADPDESVEKEYNRMFGSGLIVPSNKPIKL